MGDLFTSLLRPLWLAQDWLRRWINRHTYCLLDEHRRDETGRCKDCGR